MIAFGKPFIANPDLVIRQFLGAAGDGPSRDVL
jgi:hypothetical protein